jgi:hypothetical protein
MATDIPAKLEATASMLDGRIKETTDGGPAVNVEGYISGFPCQLEAFRPDWPFGVNYSIKTEIMPRTKPGQEFFALTIIPRIGRGFFGFITRLLFFEGAGVKVLDKNLQKTFIFNCADKAHLERFLGYPGISETLIKLHDLSFNELKIISNAGLSLSQPKSFSKLDLAVCRETFKLLAEIGQVLYERF